MMMIVRLLQETETGKVKTDGIMNISNKEKRSRVEEELLFELELLTKLYGLNSIVLNPPLRYIISVILTVNKSHSKNIRMKGISSLTVLLYGISAIENGLFFVLLRLRSSEEAMNDVSPVDMRYL
jgi:hypothetical protein